MKKIILTLLLLTSFPSLAWEIKQGNIAFQESEEDVDTGILYYPNTGFVLVTISDYCSTGQNIVLDVNDTPVKFKTHCKEEDTFVFATPLTKKGQEYIFTQFKEKNSVHISYSSFSANGFNDMIKKLNLKIERDKTAI
jgi:hypothetical protein